MTSRKELSEKLLRERSLSAQVACPACFSKPGESCTAPTAYSGTASRKSVSWFHVSRTAKAKEYLRHQTTVTSDGAGIYVSCACGWYESVRRYPPELSIEEVSEALLLAESRNAEHLRILRESVE